MIAAGRPPAKHEARDKARPNTLFALAGLYLARRCLLAATG